MLKELDEFIQNNQEDIIVTGGISDEWIYCFNNNDGIISSWDRTEKTHLIKSNNFERYILDEMADAKEEWD